MDILFSQYGESVNNGIPDEKCKKITDAYRISKINMIRIRNKYDKNIVTPEYVSIIIIPSKTSDKKCVITIIF